MKKTTLLLSLLIGAGYLFSSCEENEISTDETPIITEETIAQIEDSTSIDEAQDSNSAVYGTLNNVELNDLIHLAEEEKLARDVYNYAFQVYGLNIFKNIGASEQKHLNSVLSFLSNNNVEDPTHPNAGHFFSETLSELYANLTAQVDLSKLDALKVGATIEDLDIMDIDDFIGNTKNEDLINMYQNLKCGSRNHMRSFYALIIINEGSYNPQFISLDLFDEIINSSGEQCGAQ